MNSLFLFSIDVNKYMILQSLAVESRTKAYIYGHCRSIIALHHCVCVILKVSDTEVVTNYLADHLRFVYSILLSLLRGVGGICFLAKAKQAVHEMDGNETLAQPPQQPLRPARILSKDYLHEKSFLSSKHVR